jgi:hypothetical protein
MRPDNFVHAALASNVRGAQLSKRTKPGGSRYRASVEKLEAGQPPFLGGGQFPSSRSIRK